MSSNRLDSPKNEADFVKTWATTIEKTGLSTPAILLLELHKPLSFSISQFLLVGQPLLNLFLPPSFSRNAIHLFENPAQVEQLITTLQKQALSTSANKG
jgi:hypothetical protein